LHFVVALALIWIVVRGGPRVFIVPMLLVLAMGGRELHIHKTFTSGSMTRIAYYLNPEVMLLERLAVAAFLTAVVVGVLYAAWRYSRTLRQRLRERDSASWSFAAGVVMVPLLKAIDSTPRWVRDVSGVSFSESGLALMLSLEETMEMFLPLVFLLAVVQYSAARSRGSRKIGSARA
jgi:hypothetical protein